MKKWICLVCGWTYDEALGDPQEGLAPGTKWEDIPDDWTCPDCGVGKEDFEMVEVKAPQSAPATAAAAIVSAQDPVVIIGSGLAAHNLAKEFRKHDTTTPVVMITRDDGSLYYKPNLSSGLTTGKNPDDLVMASTKKIETDLALTLKAFTTVRTIDPAAKTVTAGGETIAYSKLVLATGAGVIRPPFAGDATDQLLHVNDLLDYRIYRQALASAEKIVIIGGGLIGCEFTNDLLNHGKQVTVIDAFGHCMPNLLPEEAGRALERALTEKGARFEFNRKVTAISKSGDKSTNGFQVQLDQGDPLSADLVLSAVGLRPHVALAERTGLTTQRGITVNRHLETSTPDIYALGDCAEVDGLNLMYVEPLLLAAKALARTLTGEKTAVTSTVMPVIVKTPTCPVVVAPPPAHISGAWDIQVKGNDVKALYRDEAGEVVGYALTGEATKNRKEWDRTLPSLWP
tara:strand:+ start:2444 stop:3814 length:1371 start_codon:yes stop_codon:yes gene_type:complete